MKKVMFFMAASFCSILVFTSCTKEDSTSLITSDYSEIVSELTIDDTYWTTTTVTDETAAERGGKKLKKIDISTLSATITGYITTNYPTGKVTAAFQTKNGETVVVVTKEDGTQVALIFDKEGNFVKEVTKGTGGGNGNNHPTSIDPKELPANITTYVSENYAGGSIVKAGIDKDGNYVVIVKNADGTVTGLQFDKEGKLIKVMTPKDKGKGGLTPTDIKTLSETITTYVSENYAGGAAFQAFTDKDGNTIVFVKSADGNIVKLMFDKDGKFVKVIKKK